MKKFQKTNLWNNFATILNSYFKLIHNKLYNIKRTICPNIDNQTQFIRKKKKFNFLYVTI